MVVNFGYEIPKWGGRLGASAFGQRVMNGWEISGIVIAQSGTPFSITDSTGATLFGTTGSRANWASGATIDTAHLSGSVESRLTQYFNTAAFTKAGTGFGNTGRNILRGPRQRNVDLSISKRIPVTERFGAELRGELFNAFNMVNFSNPSGSVTSATFGTISATTGNPRVVQLALKMMF
jgi:hypothetical protein